MVQQCSVGQPESSCLTVDKTLWRNLAIITGAAQGVFNLQSLNKKCHNTSSVTCAHLWHGSLNNEHATILNSDILQGLFYRRYLMNPKMVSNDKGRMLVPKKHYLLAALCLSCTLFFLYRWSSGAWFNSIFNIQFCLSCTLFFLYRELNQFFVERPTKQVSSSLSSLRPTNAVSWEDK